MNVGLRRRYARAIPWHERDRRDKRNEKDGDMRKPKPKPKSSYPSPHDAIRKRSNGKPNIDERAHVGQLVTIVIGSRVFAGEVVEIDTETGQILAAYITGGRMLRFKPGKPPTSKLLRDWNDKQTFFSLCPHDGWESFVQARDVLQPLYREWKEKQETKAEAKTQKQATSTGLTDEQRRAWLAKYSRPAK